MSFYNSISKTTYVDIKEAFLAKEWKSFHLSLKKLDYLHFENFLTYDCELYLKQPRNHNARSLLPITPRTIDLSLKLDDGQLSVSLEMLDYAPFSPLMQLKTRHISCWNVPDTTPLKINFHNLLENVASRSLKSSFQLDPQININLLSQNQLHFISRKCFTT
jgi:hypothetical protein